MKGAAAKMAVTGPHSSAVNMSAMTPPIFVRGEDPKEPAKKRRMSSVQMFCAPAHPALKHAKSPKVTKNITCLPYISDIGEKSKGPTANPRTNKDSPRVATS